MLIDSAPPPANPPDMARHQWRLGEKNEKKNSFPLRIPAAASLYGALQSARGPSRAPAPSLGHILTKFSSSKISAHRNVDLFLEIPASSKQRGSGVVATKTQRHPTKLRHRTLHSIIKK